MCAIGLFAACFTAPPPDLPTQFHAPEIVHVALVPKEGVITELPQGGFVVPVHLDDPNQPCVFSVLLDGAPLPRYCRQACPQAVSDGGTAQVFIGFGVSPGQLQSTDCPTIQIVVASQFALDQTNNCTTPNAAGGDVATWELDWPSCQSYEAGAVDGAFPPADAAPDTLPIVPESGIDP